MTVELEHAAAQHGWRRLSAWVAGHELWFLLIPGFFVVFSNRLPLIWVLISLAVVPVVWAARWVARGAPTVRTPLDVPFVLLLLMAGVALYPSVDRAVSASALAKLVFEVAVFYGIVNNVRSDQQVGLSIIALVGIGAVAAVLGLLNTNWVTSKLFSLPSAYQILPKALSAISPSGFNRSVVAATMILILPLNVAVTMGLVRSLLQRAEAGVHSSYPPLANQKALSLLLLSLSSLPMLVVLILTQARGAWVGFAVALALIVSFQDRRLVVVPLLLSVGAVIVAYTADVVGFVDSLLVNDALSGLEGRREIWSRAMYMLQDFPYTGIGVGTFSKVASTLYPFFLLGDTTVTHAHNLYLQAGVDFGLPGMVAYVAVLTGVLLLAVDTWRRSPSVLGAAIALGSLGGLTGYMVQGLMDYPAVSPKLGPIVWVFVGFTVAHHRFIRTHPVESNPYLAGLSDT